MKVLLNCPGFSYDVHSLVKAFYPEEDVGIVSEDQDCDIRILVADDKITVSTARSGQLTTAVREINDKTRPSVKNDLKHILYDVLSDVTKTELPWGTMTGIRPVKVPMKMINEGASDDQIADYMKSVYLCSDEKIRLAISVAKRERDVINDLTPGGFSLYVGIPFCPTTCLYCSFTSYPIASWSDRVDEYLKALKSEIDYFSEYYGGRCPDSVYIGGGTPTTLTPGQLSDLIGYIKGSFDCSNIREFTVEAGRPDSITDDKLEVLHSSGVTRISINPQTMNDRTLKIIGRSHTTAEVYRSFEAARKAGFTNINTDLILGLPGEDEDDVSNTFEKISELKPDSITIHSMAIKRAANMHRYLEEHSDIRSINNPEIMNIADKGARSLGLVPYYLYRQKNMSGNFENVGYAREGCFGIYNIVIMEEVTDIAAVGAGTISKRVYPDGRIERCDNVKDVSLYINKIDEMIERKRKLFTEKGK
ncbi:MAG: coproporphyrinogen dehydrogenase HemZ [Lachnospiraceae bacterium]|nr:coproporphyrinogen dehydrogenase HemZ [Lachnospiraceae bacterium]